ncbi:YunG family protein, partial [Micromonospora sp. NPDC005161]
MQDWHPDNAARGQCGATALIIQDLLGGELILGEVVARDAKVGYHYWNRLPDGRDVDLTADQFYLQE